MRLVLDSGGVTAVAGVRERLRQIRLRGLWPPLIPTVALVDSLTGDHRRDFHVNRLIQLCVLVPLDEITARSASALRTATTRHVSAADAIVAATADRPGGAVVLTSDAGDIAALAAHTCNDVRVELA